ncbi:MAG: glycosyltransferase family 4 protein [Flavobacterium psychrophilum]
MEMTIGLLTPEYPHPLCKASGGIGSSIQNSARDFVALGHRVVVFVYGQSSAQVLDDQGVQLHFIPFKKYAFGGWYFYRKLIQQYVNNCIAREQIQLIEAPDWTGITAFMRLNAPLVIRFHGTDAYFCHLEGRSQKLKNFLLEKWAMRQAVAFSSPTYFAAEITQFIFRLKGKNTVIIPNGIRISQFTNPNPTAFESGLIAYFGTLIRKKGVFELIEVFKQLLVDQPTARLVLVGADAPDIQSGADSTWHELQKNIPAAVLDRIQYTGKIPYEHMQTYIIKAHLCVLPSMAETQGMVTIEAMAMQKTVLTSNFGWSAELIEDGISGYCIHPKNHALYVQKIVELMADSQRAIHMGKAARTRVEQNFDSKKISIQNSNFYQDIISNL